MHLWSNKPRILVADRSEQIIQAVAKILAKEFEVVGFARDGEETLRAVIHLKPDVVVMDIIMPVWDGIRVARRLKEMNSPTKTVFLSGFEDHEYVEASLSLYRRTRAEAMRLLVEVRGRGGNQVVIDGDGEIAEICRLTCLEKGIEVSHKPSDEIPVLKVEGAKLNLVWPLEAPRGKE